MTVEHRVGDLFAAQDVQALAHGCNCAGAMGRGIAVGFKERWPEMYQVYRSKCRSGDFVPGAVFPWVTPEGLIIYNLGTQSHWRRSARLEDVMSAVDAMCAHAATHGIQRIGMPLVGAGLGRLKWEDVESGMAPIVRRYGVTAIVHRLPADGVVAE
ncbi:macro domain-containing protein [Streptomyces olivaceiscleroticus]|uniref:Macro domain-containing protein n=1 Tax=Streptomyces olivaceiscleroticus TaxID=68245 RepID=A0ABN1B6Q0_9ACTN